MIGGKVDAGYRLLVNASGSWVTISGQGIIVQSGTGVIATVLSGTGIIIQSGTGVLVQSGVGTVTTVLSGTGVIIQSGVGVTQLSGTGVIIQSGAGVLVQSGVGVIASVLSGTGVIVQSGYGVIIQSGASVITGQVTPTGILAGYTQVTADSGGTEVGSGIITLVNVRSLPGNDLMWMGPISVTSGVGYLILGGESEIVNINNLNAIYLIAETSGDMITYRAEV